MKMSFLLIELFCIFLVSCKSDEQPAVHDPEFSIVFSDADHTTVKENNIAFFDSTSGYLFLNKELNLNIGNEKPPYSFVRFSVLVDGDSLFHGTVYPSVLFNKPEELIIFSRTYPDLKSDILPFVCRVGGLNDVGNKKRIVEALSGDHLVYSGITCTLDEVKTATNNDSVLIFTMTLTNPDPVNYYVPDPGKMDVQDFNFHARVSFENKQTGEHFLLKSHWENYYWNINDLKDLSLLKGGEKLTYTWATNCGIPVAPGNYSVSLGLRVSIVDFPTSLNIPVVQEGGRIWLGYAIEKGKEISIN